jgi:hypothetical protein
MTPEQLNIAGIYGHERPLFIDSTFGVTKYDFSLFTVMVCDFAFQGIPIAWIVTSSEDARTTTLWMTALKDKLGPDIVPSCILTDAADALKAAVSAVWSERMLHLLCIWHVKKAWYENLLKKVKAADLRKALLVDLDNLQSTNFHPKPNLEAMVSVMTPL